MVCQIFQQSLFIRYQQQFLYSFGIITSLKVNQNYLLHFVFSINEKLCFFFDASDRLDFHHTVVTTLIFVYKYSIPLRYCYFHFPYSLNKCARHVTLISRNCTTKGERILKLYPGKFSRVESTRS